MWSIILGVVKHPASCRTSMLPCSTGELFQETKRVAWQPNLASEVSLRHVVNIHFRLRLSTRNAWADRLSEPFRALRMCDAASLNSVQMCPGLPTVLNTGIWPQ